MNFRNKQIDLGFHLSQSILRLFFKPFPIPSICISTLSKHLQSAAMAVAQILEIFSLLGVCMR